MSTALRCMAQFERRTLRLCPLLWNSAGWRMSTYDRELRDRICTDNNSCIRHRLLEPHGSSGKTLQSEALHNQSCQRYMNDLTKTMNPLRGTMATHGLRLLLNHINASYVRTLTSLRVKKPCLRDSTVSSTYHTTIRIWISPN